MADTQHSLQTYISDMLALEQHIREPFEAQLKDPDIVNYPSAQVVLRRLSDLSNSHIDALQALLAQQGGHEMHPVKGAVSAAAGFVASAIDMVRRTKVAKALRDDYTALSLAAVSYSMLLTTANAYGERQVAQLAQMHLRDYAQVIMEVGLVIPDVVVADLMQTGLPANPSVVPDSKAQIEQTWRNAAASERSAQSSAGDITTGTATAQTSRSV